MFLRSPLLRLATTLAGGTLVALTAAGPAAAAAGSSATTGSAAVSAEPTHYGRVTARSGLLLRDAPNRSSRVVRTVPFNSVVAIFCKQRGENVDGNNLWYLLKDGTWAWGSARYIANIGSPPPFC